MTDTSSMPEIQSLSDLLREAGLQYRVFDLGRRVTVIERRHFSEMEAGNRPYAYPLLRQAWMGIVFWDPADQAHNAVWFVKWPLDEQGLPVPAARDDFLRRVLDRRSRDDGAKGWMGDVLEANPYAFRPAEERMAVFHAKAGLMMGQPPSAHYEVVRAYLRAPSRGDWTTLGYQGIADVAARLDADGNAELLAAAIPGMPTQPLTAFCQCLENMRVPLPIAEALAERAGKAASAEEVAACIRGLSHTQATDLRDGTIGTLLFRDMGKEKEVLSAISNRAWESLRSDHLAGLFLNRLAGCEQALFNAVMADLLYLPGMRESLLTAMRNPERPPHVAAAIGELFKAYT